MDKLSGLIKQQNYTKWLKKNAPLKVIKASMFINDKKMCSMHPLQICPLVFYQNAWILAKNIAIRPKYEHFNNFIFKFLHDLTM